jgi:DNA polymerase elongation subunit (family B)
MNFTLLSKKRYFGILYETDPKKGKLKYMGLSLKRRDSCDYLKDTYGNILNILIEPIIENEENNIKKAIGYLDRSLQQLISGNVPMEKLMITKALRSDYKNPAQIAHKVLAERIGQRDPGNKPKSGDRMKFVHIVNNNKKSLQGEKIETPEFIITNRIPIDYTFYITNQLMKPLQQLFGLAWLQILENDNKHSAIRTFKTDMAKLNKECDGDLDVFMKKKEKYCSIQIKKKLFDTVLIQIINERNRFQPITGFFAKK